MGSDDLAMNIAATVAFLHACFQTSEADFETMLAYNMVVPTVVRRNMGGRALDITDLPANVHIPVLVSHGEDDRIDLAALGRYTASTVPGAVLSLYPGAGHASFDEAAPRFNSELASFVRGVQ